MSKLLGLCVCVISKWSILLLLILFCSTIDTFSYLFNFRPLIKRSLDWCRNNTMSKNPSKFDSFNILKCLNTNEHEISFSILKVNSASIMHAYIYIWHLKNTCGPRLLKEKKASQLIFCYPVFLLPCLIYSIHFCYIHARRSPFLFVCSNNNVRTPFVSFQYVSHVKQTNKQTKRNP